MSFWVGIAGGAAAGKTTLCRAMATRFTGLISIIELDSYYCDHATVSPQELALLNFDTPDAVDLTLVLRDLQSLRGGVPVEAPVYDFTCHRRSPRTRVVVPRPLMVVEGIFCLALEPLRKLLDLCVYVDTPPDIRLARRLERDIRARARSADDVLRQYLTQVRPMHERHIEPSKAYADVVLSGCDAGESLAQLLHRLEGVLDFRDRAGSTRSPA